MDLVDSKISCRFVGAGPVGCRKEGKWECEVLSRKGERRDVRNEERVEGGGGDSRIDVRRIGLSRFEDTYTNQRPYIGRSLHTTDPTRT